MKDTVFIILLNGKVFDVAGSVEKIYELLKNEGISEFIFGRKYMNFEKGINHLISVGCKQEVLIGDDYCQMSIIQKIIK